jgi:nucleoside-diphosphate-sugar epimerase
MKVLLTGGSGNVGLSTLIELIKQGHRVRIFDKKSPIAIKKLNKYKSCAEIMWGDMRNQEDLRKALFGIDVVIHTAAIIPPLADREPELAYDVNVNGTKNICETIMEQKTPPGLIYTSSIAVYGDRISNPYIRLDDEPNPNPRDTYAKQKLEAEQAIKAIVAKWLIFRLSYIVSTDKLAMDPLLFELPRSTSIEIADTRDAGLALSNAASRTDLWERTLHLAGGRECRISFGDYVDKMTELFGLGNDFFPNEAFSSEGLHCGFMDTDETERLLKFQRHTLADYFANVRKICSVTSFFARPFRKIIRYFLLQKSHYYISHLKKLGYSFKA